MQDNPAVRTCEFCHGPNRRSLRARFCSPDCKARSDQAKASEIRRQARAGRICEQCSGAIPLNRNGRARFCCRDCEKTWYNAQRQAARQAEWMAASPVCQRQQCGKPVPESRPGWSKYCSPECRVSDKDARWRGSAPHYNRWYNYGITPEQYEAMMAAQGGRCAICGTLEWMGKDKRPYVDHAHESGQVRGLLCSNCNFGLGNFGDDPARLRAAADYLEKAVMLT